MLIKRDALNKGMMKSDIDAFLKDKGDYVKMDHLSRFMKESLPVDIRRYVATLLAEIYEKKGMVSDSAKMYEVAAMCSVTFQDKIKYFTKEAIVYIKTGMFERVDDSIMKAASECNSKEKAILQSEIVLAYKKAAQEYETKMQRSHAVKIYEKMLTMTTVSDAEKIQVRDKLIDLYEKLGKVDRYMTLKRIKEGKNPYS